MKYSFIIKSVLVAFSFSILYACGGSDDSDANVVVDDGVNITKRKKIKTVTVEMRAADDYGDIGVRLIDYNHFAYDGFDVRLSSGEYYNEGLYYRDGENFKNPLFRCNFGITYDDDGRLSKITWGNRAYETQYPKSDENTWRVRQKIYPIDIAVIDYNNKTISIPTNMNLRMKDGAGYGENHILRFVTNEKGYISQIGDYMLKYDNEGFLIGVDKSYKMWALVYSGEEFVNWIENSLVSSTSQTYYVDYGNDDKDEILYVNLKLRSPGIEDGVGFRLYMKVFFAVAYQNGLFGKTVKTFKDITKRNEKQINLKEEWHVESTDEDWVRRYDLTRELKLKIILAY